MRYVLFVCTRNAGRSQMAQAFFEQLAPADLRAESAGLDPAERIHPVVVEAMRESGIDISDRKPKKLTAEMQLHADWGVTLACGGRCPYVPSVVEDWDVADPQGRTIAEVRAIRDQIRGRVERLLVEHSDDIRRDRTAHEARLAKILPGLIDEFGDSRDAELIRACADAVLERFDDAPIRSHAPTLAVRRARRCLKAESCCELAAP